MKVYDDRTAALLIFWVMMATIAMMAVLGAAHLNAAQACVESGRNWSNGQCWDDAR